ncbi:MAG: hypothetical protein K2Y27_12830 [Xanthobacteraceae bacterium]|nr:hypothetical protein [Xanthobacteraceae bacterium]
MSVNTKQKQFSALIVALGPIRSIAATCNCLLWQNDHRFAIALPDQLDAGARTLPLKHVIPVSA